MLIETDLARKDWQAALNAANKLFDVDSSTDKKSLVALQASRAACLLELDRFQEAETAANQVVSNEKSESVSTLDLSRAKSILAVCLAKKGQTEEAKRIVFEAANQLESEFKETPNHLLFYYPRAIKRVIKVLELSEAFEELDTWQNTLNRFESRIKKRVN